MDSFVTAGFGREHFCTACIMPLEKPFSTPNNRLFKNRDQPERKGLFFSEPSTEK